MNSKRLQALRFTVLFRFLFGLIFGLGPFLAIDHCLAQEACEACEEQVTFDEAKITPKDGPAFLVYRQALQR